MTTTPETTTTVHVVRVTEIVGGVRQQGTWTWPAVLDRDEIDGLRGMSPADVLAEFAWDEGVDVEVASDATSIRWTRDGREYVAEVEPADRWDGITDVCPQCDQHIADGDAVTVEWATDTAPEERWHTSCLAVDIHDREGVTYAEAHSRAVAIQQQRGRR